ncbi:hypothetical protein ABN034_30225 [Actinopolymorpha sp. B11F2]|uniref:hypothetical protein n=1 Tax=Actinopolymorpha sp. B11F2 TaxID=3160862 RepID=UPI0032E38E9D
MAAPTVLPEPLLTRPFTLAEARNSGVSRDMLRGRRLRRPFRGVFVPSSLPDTVETRDKAARLVLPETAVRPRLDRARRHR